MIYQSTDHLPERIALIDVLGFIPHLIDDDDERPLAAQIDEHYVSGWKPFEGFTHDPETHALMYDGDPPMLPWVEAKLRDETLRVYPYSWVTITQPDGSFEASRLD
jgi:hypothetical protein